MISLKPKEMKIFLEKEYADKNEPLIFVDGQTFYEGCGIGGMFYYSGKECVLELNRNIVDPSRKISDWEDFKADFKGQYEVKTAKEYLGEKFPIKRK